MDKEAEQQGIKVPARLSEEQYKLVFQAILDLEMDGDISQGQAVRAAYERLLYVDR